MHAPRPSSAHVPFALGLLAAASAAQEVRYRIPAGGALHFDPLPVQRLDDVDGDGSADFAMGVGSGGGVEVRSGLDGSLLHGIPDPTGPVPSPDYGAALEAVRDLDGDGVRELAVGATHGGSTLSTAFVELRSGADGALLLRVSDVVPGTDFGAALAAIEDLDGDGLEDLIVGTPADFNTGGKARVQALSTADGRVLYTVEEDPLTGLGFSLAVLGDLDGDGVDDFAAGRPGGFPTGEVQVISGADGSTIRLLTGSRIQFGHAVANAGDLDGDGLAELAVSSLLLDNANGRAGRVFVFAGSDGALLREYRPRGPFGAMGLSMAGGHVDRDGVPDLLVGQANLEATGNNAFSVRGAVLAFSGRDGSLLFEFPGEVFGGELGWRVELLGDVDGERGTELLASGLGPPRVLSLSFAPTPRHVPRSRLVPAAR